MKKIVVFGATGNTGLCSLEYAVKSGYKIRAFVRSENKIPDHLRDKVEPIVGDVTKAEIVSEAISGMDGVVVVLGTRDEIKPTTVMSEGMKNIIDAMKTHNVQVVSVCLSAFLFYTPEKVPTIFKDLNDDHQRMFDLVKQCGLKWIAVLPPRITELPSSKYTIKYDESPGHTISKYDLGEFLVKSLVQPEYYKKVCGIATNS
ncbi:PREDICTED: flavin reductase (NADPH) [Ceratosolen solmsi marchali]|uniref:Flavin reductase (NADPH) n=1 Tax=Ceratosolen solmsi marchali TaxID=326594 RepID=A0AAJ6YDT4_9HYME|nr:PREDICTED: flavin reductase (NADPH) [Ceratosolen solmsi marchali]